MEQLLVVMEYTGIYTYGLERYLHKESIAFVKRGFPYEIRLAA